MANDHGVPDGKSEHEWELEMANELIGYANAKLNDGVNPLTIAAGLRHAAANFSAFASIHVENGNINVATKLEEFQAMLEYYGKRHGESRKPLTGLEQLVETVKNQ